MENFTAFNPTKLFFGKDVVSNMYKTLNKYGKKVLLLYGKKSAKKYGYYSKIIEQIKKAGIKYVEYSGIKPNPVIEDVEKAADLCKKENVDFILALGGGSVIDSAKIISLVFANNEPVWDIMKYKVEVKKAIPIIAVLTFAATGTEMNSAAVLQNHNTHEKIGYVNELIFPKESYLDPNFTISMPKEQTIYGIVDMIAHSLESFFAYGKADLSDRFVASLLKEIFEIAPKLLNNLTNYQLRARIMWASTVALNGTLYRGRKTNGDWGVHGLGHVLSYLFDTPHGATLSIFFPAWMKHLKPKISERLEKLGFLLTGKKTSAEKTIDIIKKFFKSIDAPTNLEQIDICPSDTSTIKKYMINANVSGMNYKLNENDYEQILNLTV